MRKVFMSLFFIFAASMTVFAGCGSFDTYEAREICEGNCNAATTDDIRKVCNGQIDSIKDPIFKKVAAGDCDALPSYFDRKACQSCTDKPVWVALKMLGYRQTCN